MPLEKITKIEGAGVHVPGNDIDTDRIIPARFMKCVTFDGLGEYLFYDVRFAKDGKSKNHPLNDPKHPGYVPGSTIAPAQIIRVIREAGGIPVLAHPIYLKRDDIIRRFVDDGLVGLEAYHSGHPPEAVLRYERLADELHLLKTGGSDFHGDAKEGLPVGAVKVPYELVEALKAWKTANVR